MGRSEKLKAEQPNRERQATYEFLDLLDTWAEMGYGLPVPSPFGKKIKKISSNSVHRSNPGPNRRPNSAKLRTEDWIEEDWSGSSPSSVRSGLRPKTVQA